jgi:hypothetical protein
MYLKECPPISTLQFLCKCLMVSYGAVSTKNQVQLLLPYADGLSFFD